MAFTVLSRSSRGSEALISLAPDSSGVPLPSSQPSPPRGQGRAEYRGLIVLAVVGVLLPFYAFSKTGPAAPVKELRFELSSSAAAQPLRLRGAGAKQQLLVTGVAEDGTIRDLTRELRYQVSPPAIARVDTNGVLHPLADGKATVNAKTASGVAASLPIVVENFKADPPINFANQIVPIFTKAGCNSGGCHGKSSGQNGFRLSLLGFEPAEDYEHLVKEARGRRLFPASPENSLLLLKATAMLPHGGGKRLDQDSDDYKLVVRWISEGMPYGKASDPTVAGIEVLPKERILPLGGEQQLAVIAHYTDGSTEDVTRS